MGDVGANWAGNYEFRAAELRTPESIEQLQELVSASPRIRLIRLHAQRESLSLELTNRISSDRVGPSTDAEPPADAATSRSA